MASGAGGAANPLTSPLQPLQVMTRRVLEDSQVEGGHGGEQMAEKSPGKNRPAKTNDLFNSFQWFAVQI
ncbi:MAG: hypothetical protein IH903_04870 [Proteobacteria bacterium]|nr:hypothetical protein [Pseudomonadota bacterium]